MFRKIFTSAIFSGSISKLSTAKALRTPVKKYNQSYSSASFRPYRSLFVSSLLVSSALAEEKDKEQKDDFIQSFENTSSFYKKVFLDLGFTKQQAGAILDFHRLLYVAYPSIDFEFNMNTSVTQRAIALEDIKAFFSPKNFRQEFEMTYMPMGENERTEIIKYHQFPSSTSLAERHQKLLKIAKTLKVEVSEDTAYNETIIAVARKVSTVVEPQYLALRSAYNLPFAVITDGKQADIESENRSNRCRMA